MRSTLYIVRACRSFFESPLPGHESEIPKVRLGEVTLILPPVALCRIQKSSLWLEVVFQVHCLNGDLPFEKTELEASPVV